MTPAQVIVLATPAFLLAIAAEWAWGASRGRPGYRPADALASLAAGMLSQLVAVLVPVLTIGLYTAAWDRLALWRADAFWQSPPGWLLALALYDFCYYWLHRGGHRVALLWAAHVVHHQSQHYNLSTALRQSATGPLLAWVFYLPLALAGVPPLVVATVALVDLLYQFWVHTEQVGKLGWFDRWFCSPSNHRVHHAVNDGYLDRNYGGILVVWDRLFGTFREEGERCVYGTRAPLDSWDPLWSNAQVYAQLLHDSWHAQRWADKLRVWCKPPGWRPPDVAQRFPRPAFDIARVRHYDPPLPRAQLAWALLHFGILLAGVAAFLWHAHQLPLRDAVLWLGVLCTGLWSLGALLQGRLRAVEALALQAAALATASAALGLLPLHQATKPLALALLLAAVPGRVPAGRGRGWLLAALACSLAGDVLLLWPSLFLPGLVAFLAAHLAYIALLRQDTPWLPRRAALGATLAAGVVVYAALAPALGPVLRVAVAAYVGVIAVMAAQALGRAAVHRTPAARAVAIGAVAFMASDTLLAVNRFLVPLPLAPVWVLGSYYLAQWLIARNVLTPAAAAAPA